MGFLSLRGRRVLSYAIKRDLLIEGVLLESTPILYMRSLLLYRLERTARPNVKTNKSFAREIES